MTTLSPPKTEIKSAITLYSNGQIQEALDSVEALTKDYPDVPLLYNISGVCYRAISKLDEAVKSFEKALALKPDYTDVHNNLGIALMELGQLDKAVKCYKKALALKPDYAEAHNNLGLTLQELGQANEAVKSYEKAIAIKSDYAEAHNNLGISLRELDQLDKAVKCYKKALALKPDYANAYNNLGNTLKELGQLNAAAKCYEKALIIKPDYVGAYNNLGIALMELDQLDEAVKCYEKALEIKPDYADAHNNLGSVLMGLDQLDEAVKSLEKALALKPDYAEAHNNFGIIFKELGQKDKAIKSFEKALSFNPEYAKVYRQLVSIKKYIASDPQITQMQSILSMGELSQSDRMHLCFALAKVYEDLGKQDELFKFLGEGNRLRKQELNYSFDMDQITCSVIKKLFSDSPSIVEKSFSYEASTIRPIFILGMPRSGTSLVEQIIASHHAVYGAGELHTLNNIITPIVKDHSTNNMNSLSEKNFLYIRQQYLDSVSRLNVPEKVITDKMTLNFRWIGFILTAFPEAKIVHLKRDAMAICWSNYKHYFSGRGLGFPYDMDDLAGFYGLYTDLMALVIFR
jgi:tetratricopeptide (TPR) repeat protein